MAGNCWNNTHDDPVRIGALEAMKLIASPLPTKSGQYERSDFIKQWLSNESSDHIKLASLKYLKFHGKYEDIGQVQIELDKANSKTSRISLETILSIQLRHNKGNALEIAVKSNFEIIDESLLKEILSDCVLLDDTTLKEGLNHKNVNVRLECFHALRDKKKLSSEEIEFLLKDQSTLIRKNVIDFMLSDGMRMDEERIRSLLIQPDKNINKLGIIGLLRGSNSDEGESYFDEYLFKKYSSLPEKELQLLVGENIISNDIPYFALCTQYFKNNSEELRKNIDDHFEQRFSRYIEYLKKIGLDAKTIEKWEILEDHMRKKLTRKGLDVLCKKGVSSDILAIRNSLRSDYVGSSMAEISYMAKFGEWSDISLILNAKEEYRCKTILTEPLQGGSWNKLVSRAIYNIGRDRLEELLKFQIPSPVLVEVIKMCSMANFSVLSDEILLSFLNHEEDAVRRIFSLKIIVCLNKSRIVSLLKEYTADDQYRYYNTIFWLDLGASIKSTTVKKAALFALNE